MPADAPREASVEVSESVSWQITYAAFMGATLCAFGFYGALYLLHTGWGWPAIVGGVAGLVATLGVGVSFIALMTGAVWALRVCRVFAAAATIVSAGGLARGVRIAAESPEWKLPAGRVLQLLFETALELHVMLPLGSVLLCVLIVSFLFGRSARQFFNR